jgi:cysteine desulfurase
MVNFQRRRSGGPGGSAEPSCWAMSRARRHLGQSDMGLDVIYLDYNATTPVAAEVLEEMLPWFSENFWNAASSHIAGRHAAAAVDTARERVAQLISAAPSEVAFTSGATEANNLALQGAVDAAPRSRNRVVVSGTEHKAVLDTALWMSDRGTRVTVLSVDRDGLVDPAALSDALDDDVAIVSVMLANNETGVIASIGQLAALTKQSGALFHTDAAQAPGKLAVDVEALRADLVSLSAHKMYGPKGVGALYIRRGTMISPLLHGGGHERGLRSGTLNTAGIVGFGASAVLAGADRDLEAERQGTLVRELLRGLSDEIGGVEVAAASARRLPNTLNVRVRGADSDAVIANAPSVAMSSGSACTSLVPAPSHVLVAMGRTNDEASESLRFSVGRPTQMQDIREAISRLVPAIERVRALSGDPLRPVTRMRSVPDEA